MAWHRITHELAHLPFETRSADRPSLSFQAIPTPLNTGTLTKSTKKAKTAAPKSAPPITSNGRGAIAIPRFASVEAINRSTTDESTSHVLGRVDQRD
jgi:hypothetical protein